MFWHYLFGSLKNSIKLPMHLSARFNPASVISISSGARGTLGATPSGFNSRNAICGSTQPHTHAHRACWEGPKGINLIWFLSQQTSRFVPTEGSMPWVLSVRWHSWHLTCPWHREGWREETSSKIKGITRNIGTRACRGRIRGKGLKQKGWMGYWDGIGPWEGGQALAHGAQRSWGCPWILGMFQARLVGAWSSLG